MANSAIYSSNNVQSIREPIDHHNTTINKPLKSAEIFSKTLAKENAKISHNFERNKAGFRAESIKKSASLRDKNIPSNMPKQNGTDLARMKGIAKELTDQLYGFLWTSMAEGVNKNPAGGFGEEMFQKSLWPELVKASRGTESDELQDAIVRDLVKSEARAKRKE